MYFLSKLDVPELWNREKMGLDLGLATYSPANWFGPLRMVAARAGTSHSWCCPDPFWAESPGAVVRVSGGLGKDVHQGSPFKDLEDSAVGGWVDVGGEHLST